MLPWMRNASPPNMRRSVRPDSSCTSARTRSASSALYAIRTVSRTRAVRAGDRVLQTEAIEIAVRRYLAGSAVSRLRELAGSVEIDDVSAELRHADRTT